MSPHTWLSTLLSLCFDFSRKLCKQIHKIYSLFCPASFFNLCSLFFFSSLLRPLPPSIPLSLRMYDVYMYAVCVPEHRHAHARAHMWRSEDNLGCRSSLPTLFETRSLRCMPAACAGLAEQSLPGVPRLHLPFCPKLGLQVCSSVPGCFLMCTLGIQTHVLMLAWQILFWVSKYPGSEYYKY